MKYALLLMVLVFSIPSLEAEGRRCRTAQPMWTMAETPKEESKDIVDVAASDKKFTTLVAAVKAADLVETLKGKGPFTVFAPNDDAFKKLDKGTLEELLKPENKDKLVKILKFHVVSGKFLASDVVKLNDKEVKTVEGGSVKIEVKNDVVRVNGVKVTQTDIVCSNGVIHIIDSVLLPK